MAGQPQKTSRIGRVSIADFDDQLWPINCAILLLAGFASALVVATSRFDDPRLLYNAWARLLTVGLIVGLMFWGTFRLQGKMRRRMQLSALVSLLLHVALMVLLYQQSLTLATLRDTSLAESRRPTEQVPLPEFEIRNPLPPEQNFERRVETAEAEQVPDRVESPQVAQQETAPRQIAAAKDTPVPAEVAQSREPSPVEIRRAEPSAPRRSEAAGGQISRQDLKDRPVAEEPVPTPRIEANGASAVAQLAPHVIPLPRQDREARLPNRQTFATLPSTQAYQERVDLPRREAAERSTADASAAPLPARQPAASEAVVPEDAIPERIAQGESLPAQPAPNAPSVRRQVAQAAEPATMNPAAEPAAQPTAAAQSTPRRQAPGDRPQVAENSTALPSRTTSAARLPSPQLIEQPVVASSAAPAATGTSPPEAAVTRREASVPAGAGPGQAAGLASQSPLTVSPAQPRRADRAGDPSFTASTASPGRMARTPNAADVATDSVEVDNPVIGAVAGSGQPSAEPAGINVGKSSAGVAGLVGLGGTASASRNAPGAGGDLPGSGGRAPLVARVGQPRAPSGGQPSGSLGVPTQRLSKTPAPGALLDAGTADVAGPPSLAGTGGGAAGSPSATDNAVATAVMRQAGAGTLPAGRPDAGSGGTEGGGGPGLLAAARVGPAGPAEPMPGSQPSPGGGRLARSAMSGAPLPGTTVDEGGAATAPKGSVAVDGPSGPSGGSDSGAAPATGGPAAGTNGTNGAGSPGRASAGLPAGLLARAPGSAAQSVAGPASAGSVLAGGAGLPRAASAADRNAMPAVAGGGAGAPLRRSSLPGEVSGSLEAEDVQLAGTAPVAGTRTDTAPLGPGEGLPSRRVGGLPVQIAAPAGPGGLDVSPSPEVGLPSRKARPESEFVHPVGRRFVIERSGGELAVDALVREPAAPAFRQRDPGRREGVGKARGGTEGTERAVEMGIDFLARHQAANGSWSLNDFGGGRPDYANAGLGQMQSDTAATGLALLSFLGAGYTHLDDKHRLVVARGLDYLVRNQKPNGDLFAGGSQYVWFYSHGIAAIALCEAYGMTRDPQLREPAQKAIDFIIASQHPTLGGWRYDARAEWLDTDTSVSGWQLMALKSGEMAGLKVPPGAYTKVKGWLDMAQAPGGDPSRYVYNPRAPLTPDKKHGRLPSLAMTAEGLLMRLYLGWEHGNADLARGADYLKSNLPAVGTKANPTRDAYYWYYATQVMFQMGGEHWKAWNDALYPLLVNSQEQRGTLAGSWDPTGPVRDTWGEAGGRIYVTAMHILMLEVYYRHLPLFQTLANP